MAEIDFDREWTSRYKYPAGDEGELEGVHTVRLEPTEGHIEVKSLPDEKSELLMELTQDGDVLSGTWRERTQLEGRYKGQVFHGVVQLLMKNEFTRAEGKWLGFSQDRTKVNVGDWILEQKQRS